MDLHDIFLIIHLLLFCYWLGGDMGVFYSSSFVVDPKVNPAARLVAARIMVNLDLVPRICMTLMLTVGGVLSHYEGVEHLGWQWPLILLLAPVWLGMVLFIHMNEGKAVAKTVTRIDFWFRWLIVISVCASAILATVTGRLAPAPWIAGKLLIFAGMVFCGLMIRRYIGPYIQGIHALAKGGITPDQDDAMSRSLAKCRTFVYAIWAGLVLETVIGVVKPGSPEYGSGMAAAGAWLADTWRVLLPG